MIPEEAIRLRSYLIWERDGCPEGKAHEHWLRARAELEFESRPPLQQLHDWERYVVARPHILRPPQKVTSARVSIGKREASRRPFSAAR